LDYNYSRLLTAVTWPTMNLLGEPPLTNTLSLVYLIFILVLLIIYKLAKSIKTQILLVFVRALLGCLLPLPLVFLALSLLVKALAVVLTIVSLIIFYYVYKLVKMLAEFAKQAGM